MVGLTGGLASGKSTIAKMFEEEGAFLIDADTLARYVVEPGKAAWKDIVQTFGKDIVRSDRTLDREKIGNLVFADPRKLLALTRIVHPRVAREQSRIARSIAEKTQDSVIVYDAPLLIEAEAHRRMDRIIVVSTPQHVQLERACRRGGLTRQEAFSRIRLQMPLREKKQYADYVMDGTLPLRRLRKIVKNLYAEFHEAAQGRPHVSRKRP